MYGETLKVTQKVKIPLTLKQLRLPCCSPFNLNLYVSDFLSSPLARFHRIPRSSRFPWYHWTGRTQRRQRKFWSSWATRTTRFQTTFVIHQPAWFITLYQTFALLVLQDPQVLSETLAKKDPKASATVEIQVKFLHFFQMYHLNVQRC